MATVQDVLTVAEEIRQYVIDLPTKLLVRAGQIVVYSGLSDISESLGTILAGEFRAGNRHYPGTFFKTGVAGTGFTGMRMAYPALTYDLDGTPTEFHLVGVNDDILQFGVNAEDGTLVAGGGSVVLDIDGITAVAGTIAGWTINSDHLLSPDVPGIKIASTGSIETTNFVTGIGGVGWRITKDGNVEFNNAVIRGELRTTVFTYQEVQAVAGTMGVFPSAGVLLETTGMIPAISGSINIKIKDPEYAHAPLFGVDDILRIKDAARDTWLKVTGVTDSTTYYTYACTVMSGTTGTTYTAGQAVVSYGVSGEGFLLMEAVGTEAPYFSVRTHAGTPYGAGNEEHVRLGNLNGTPGTSTNIYGAYIGDATQYLKYTGGVLTLAGNGSGITSIDGGNITTGYIDADRIAAGSISANKIEANSITSDQLDTNVFRLKALAPSSLTMLCHFDGQEPYETDFTGNPTGHMGQAPEVSGGVIYRPGKFGKGVEVSEATTNLCTNPSFETNTTGWSTLGTNTINRSSEQVFIGQYSLKATYQDSVVFAYQSITLSAAKYIYSVRVYIPSTYDGLSISINFNNFTSATGTIVANADMNIRDEWQTVSVDCTPDAGDVAGLIRIYTTSGNEPTVGKFIYIDAVQVEQKDYLTSYCDGSLPGCTWSSTAHASTSTRTRANLIYPQEIFPTTEGSISLWLRRDAKITTSLYAYCLSYSTGKIAMGLTSTRKVFAYWGGMLTSSGGVELGEYNHIVITKEAGTLKIYINGVLDTSGTVSAVDGTPVADFFFGSGWLTGGHLNAIYDEFAVFSRALTADEVRAIYESDAPLSANTSAWEFRSSNNLIWMDSNGLFVNDQSGHNAFGVIAVDNYAWGGFTTSDLDAGDIVFGRNVAGSSAIKWDISSGKFGFYGNANGTPQVEIGTDGKLLAGSGTVKLDVKGITAGSSNNILRIDPSNATYMLWLGHATASSAPFSVKKDGTVYSRGNNMSTAIVTRGSAQSIPNAVASGGQLIAYDTQIYVSPTSMHSTTTNNNRLTAPMKGIYEVKASGKFGVGVGSSSYRQLGVYRYNSGGTVLGDIAADYRAATADASTYVGITAMLQLNAGDYIVSRAYHQYGANLNYTPYYFSLTLIKALE